MSNNAIRKIISSHTQQVGDKDEIAFIDAAAKEIADFVWRNFKPIDVPRFDLDKIGKEIRELLDNETDETLTAFLDKKNKNNTHESI